MTNLIYNRFYVLLEMQEVSSNELWSIGKGITYKGKNVLSEGTLIIHLLEDLIQRL